MRPPDRTRRLRIGFAGRGRAAAIGGTHYLKNLLAALRSLPEEEQPEIVLVHRTEHERADMGAVEQFIDDRIYLDRLARGSQLWQSAILRLEAACGIRVPVHLPLSRYVRRHKLDVVCFASAARSLAPVPVVGWIPDFQHLHHPEYFSASAIEQRNRDFTRLAQMSARVLVSSHAALADFVKFSPALAHKARVLQFVAQVPEAVYDQDPAWVCGQYNIPERYFFLPNQFWKHKNHETVLEALALSKKACPDVVVVCTGQTSDNRFPGFFPELLARVSELGLRDNFIVLGLVGHDHMFSLMRQSLAVLQPSLFEGWSTTIEEAKSLGKGMIVSDIPVHREQDPEAAVYFVPKNAERLAEILNRYWQELRPGPDDRLEPVARKRLGERVAQFGSKFMEIIKEVTSEVT